MHNRSCTACCSTLITQQPSSSTSISICNAPRHVGSITSRCSGKWARSHPPEIATAKNVWRDKPKERLHWRLVNEWILKLTQGCCQGLKNTSTNRCYWTRSCAYRATPSKFLSMICKHMAAHGEKGWRSGESARLPPMWPRFDSRTWRHKWVEFVLGSRPCSKRFFSG